MASAVPRGSEGGGASPRCRGAGRRGRGQAAGCRRPAPAAGCRARWARPPPRRRRHAPPQPTRRSGALRRGVADVERVVAALPGQILVGDHARLAFGRGDVADLARAGLSGHQVGLVHHAAAIGGSRRSLFTCHIARWMMDRCSGEMPSVAGVPPLRGTPSTERTILGSMIWPVATGQSSRQAARVRSARSPAR
jgi:hypothetical protein